MTLFDIVVLLAGWAFTLSSPLLRTVRTGIVLGALTALFVAAGMIGAPGASILRIAVTGLYLLALWQFQFWLAGLSRADEYIDSWLRNAMRDVADAHGRWVASRTREDRDAEKAARMATARACSAAVAVADGLAPPSDAWREALRLIRGYFVALGDATAPVGLEADASSDKSRDRALSELNEAANRAWQSALRRKDAHSTRSPRAS